MASPWNTARTFFLFTAALLITTNAFAFLASVAGLPSIVGAMLGAGLFILAWHKIARHFDTANFDDQADDEDEDLDSLDKMVKGLIEYTNTHPDYIGCKERHRQAVEDEATTAGAWETRDQTKDANAIELAYLRARFHRQEVEAEQSKLWSSLIKQYMDSRP